MFLQLCDGIGVARLLNATMVLPKFEVAAYWNESRYADLSSVVLFCLKYAYSSSYWTVLSVALQMFSMLITSLSRLEDMWKL
jgi:hypothetical protein